MMNRQWLYLCRLEGDRNNLREFCGGEMKMSSTVLKDGRGDWNGIWFDI